MQKAESPNRGLSLLAESTIAWLALPWLGCWSRNDPSAPFGQPLISTFIPLYNTHCLLTQVTLFLVLATNRREILAFIYFFPMEAAGCRIVKPPGVFNFVALSTD